MRYKYFSVVSSPFQLLCVNEYIELHSINSIKIYSYYDNIQEKIQFESLISYLELRNVKLRKAIKVLQYLDPFIYSFFIKPEVLIIGNYYTRLHRLYRRQLKKIKVILVDDGLISMKLEKNFAKKEITSPYNDYNLLDKFLGINNHFKFELFTIFEIQSNIHFSVSNNNLSYIKSLVKECKKEKTIFIIGQPLVEKNFTKQLYYFEYLKKVQRGFTGYRQIYFPSRKESKENIEKLANKFGFEIIRPDLNIEIYLIKNKLIPERIIGITTSALVSLSKIFEKLNINLKINYHYFEKFNNNQYSKFSYVIFREFEKMGIKKLKL